MFRKLLFVASVLLLLSGASTSYAQQAIAAWHFNENSGSTAFAATGSVNGALQGNAAFNAGGISGNAVSMTSAGAGFVDMGNNFGFAGTSTFSMVAWVKLNAGDSNGYIVAGRHQATVVAGYFFSMNNAGAGSGEVTGGSSFYQSYPNPTSSNLNLNDGNWHQLVGVHDLANGQARLYVDGVLRDTENYTNFTAAAANFAVGGILNPAGNQMVSSFTGMTDEVSLWDVALTDADVSFLFNNPGAVAVPEPGTMFLMAVAAVAASVPCYRRWKKSTQRNPLLIKVN